MIISSKNCKKAKTSAVKFKHYFFAEIIRSRTKFKCVVGETSLELVEQKGGGECCRYRGNQNFRRIPRTGKNDCIILTFRCRIISFTSPRVKYFFDPIGRQLGTPAIAPNIKKHMS